MSANEIEQPVPSQLSSLKREQGSLISDNPPDVDTGVDQNAKRIKLTGDDASSHDDRDNRRKGTAPIKAEFLVTAVPERQDGLHPQRAADDDAAEAFHHDDRQPASHNPREKAGKRKKNKGQNTDRKFGAAFDEIGLCSSRAYTSEFSPKECSFGEKCKFAHDLRKYLGQYKKDDITTFDGQCPVWRERGSCSCGWRCRFVKSHSKEVEHADGRRELVLVEDADTRAKFQEGSTTDSTEIGVANKITPQQMGDLTRKKFPTTKSDKYIPWMDSLVGHPDEQGQRQVATKGHNGTNSSSPEPERDLNRVDNAATYVEVPFRTSEKRRLYYGPDTPVLAPLTTQGNLPFRRLCTSLGASFTYSEMAMSMPLLQGQKSEWALMKAHESELKPPTFTSKDLPMLASLTDGTNIVYDYNHDTDLRFGAQISANKPWLAIKTAEVLTTLLPGGLRDINMNCGCPIDLVYREGAGSALMDSPSKLDKMLRGMNAVSNEVPITCKIRTGTRDKIPTAQKLVERLILGASRGPVAGSKRRDTPCGVAAITLHGRSRQQRYTREADWDYIQETAALIKGFNVTADQEADTIREADERDQPNGASNSVSSGRRNRKTYFLGNGDVFSHTDYYDHLAHAGVDAVMVARGALIKPWIFEEIAAGQYLDKTSTQRLGYIEQFTRYALAAWGTDTHGLSVTRRFLLEYLSFAHRYIPIGLLEHLPPKINERPPKYRGRDELETLMASDSYLDWIKITEMFLGKVKDTEGREVTGWIPKHKSNAYEAEAQG